MAVPSSFVLKTTGFLRGMQVGLLVMALGAAVFIPAALSREYMLFLLALFIIGTGLAILQTASNPYITILGPSESAAKRISIMGICNKVAGAIAPLVLGAIVLNNADELLRTLTTLDLTAKAQVLNELARRVIVPYSVMASLLLLLAFLLRFAKLPEISTEEKTSEFEVGKRPSIRAYPQVILGVVAIFCTVGVEVIAGDTIINYGLYLGISLEEAKRFTSLTLSAMVVGYGIGIVLIPRYLKQEFALTLYSLLGVSLAVLAMFTQGFTSVVCIALLGIANAMLWPAIWPIALTGVGSLTGFVSSLLIMGISGGAILPLLYGRLVMSSNNQMAYWILLPCYLFTAYYGLFGLRLLKRYNSQI